MRLRPELLLVPFVAGAIWLVLDVQRARSRSGPEPGRDVERELGGNPDVTATEVPVPAAAAVAAGPALPGVPVQRVPRAAEPQLPAPDPGSGTTRGRLVDDLTLEPIAYALVVTEKRNDWTDLDGWFDTGVPLDELGEVLVLNVGNNTNTPEVPRASWTRLSGAWQVPLAIGPTFRLRFAGLEVTAPEAWDARLTTSGGREERWLSVRAGPPPFVRYDRPVNGQAWWLEARSRDGLHEGRGEIASLAGVHEVEVVCRERAVLRGKVIDELGVPWRELALDALQMSAAPFPPGAEVEPIPISAIQQDWMRASRGLESLGAKTGADGSFQLSAGEPGRMRVRVQSPSETRPRVLTLDVPRGITQAPDIVLERKAPLGSIEGSVVGRMGVAVEGSVRLRALDGSGLEMVDELGPIATITVRIPDGAVERSEESPATIRTFSFEGVPPGRFELAVFSEHAYPCAPASFEVQAPAQDLVFTVDDGVALRPYFLELTDAESGTEVRPVLAMVRVEGERSWREVRPADAEPLVELAEGADFEWIATSPGYRVASGNRRAFRVREDSLVNTCALRPGFGARLELKDMSALGFGQNVIFAQSAARTGWRAPAVGGAEILVDGVRVTTSDRYGVAELDLQDVGRIEVRLGRWRVLDSRGFRDGRVLTFPVAQIWMVRE